ncbi:asparagine synthase [Nonlabens spongiae]|uniref:asparagine synthase (glutamine-hydrolyzing) n=1 Tax=Nonlabens spongiae TaxID=331648 RepID=A0A1W6MG13_9FLAO|nr:asparagine synthase [Nonlabens spongiae]ARN76535.1 asparagine synthase [Nonlabens spongiae]
MTTSFKSPIIPSEQKFARIHGESHEPDLKSICLYAATGFFWGDATYYRDLKAVQPGTLNNIDEDGFLLDSKPWFNWYYEPHGQSFQESVKQHELLLEQIIDEQVGEQNVILPLSGGLDSRSQAVALHKLGKKVSSYSYSFAGGFKEHEISEQIAKKCNFEFQAFEIPHGYLWDDIEKLAQINGCYSEFTHPRQMAVVEDLRKLDGVFSLGHWGDVLFDRGGDEGIEQNDLVKYIHKKVIKKGGLELATQLWKSWGVEGNFQEYLSEVTLDLLKRIEIKNTSAKVRAFKSMYWAPRWTSINMSVFKAAHPITLPYYDDRMCELICNIPEEHLADRKIQIEYIKQNNPAVAQITWQDHKPYNLFNYHRDKSPNNLPYRVKNKIKRMVNDKMGRKYIQRNWELQFLGDENKQHLESYLFNDTFSNFIDPEIVQKVYASFKNDDQVYYSHPVSMLLTLSLWNNKLRD